MATKKKKKHGKIEKKKSAPFLQFKLGVMLLLIIFSFGGMFGIYMFTATSDPNYWENEIINGEEGSQAEAEASLSKGKNVTNPVPLSNRAEDSRMEKCAFIGDFSKLTAYYNTKTELVFTDNLTGMSESRMNSISRNVTEAKAIYIWYGYPENADETREALKNLVATIKKQHNKPIYLLTVLPTANPDECKSIDEWNSVLFAAADNYSLHYVDVSTSLKSSDGTLSAEYQNEETLYKTVGEIILTHIAD